MQTTQKRAYWYQKRRKRQQSQQKKQKTAQNIATESISGYPGMSQTAAIQVIGAYSGRDCDVSF